MFRGAHPSILVTGGCGFIGTNFIRTMLGQTACRIVNLDLLTYAGHEGNLEDLAPECYQLVVGDVCDSARVAALIGACQPDAIVNFAAESHVDRSIRTPDAFIRTNVLGTFTLIDAARAYWSELEGKRKAAFRFLHVSTDEVFGDIEDTDPTSEEAAFRPNSPYAASKAGADHIVRAYHRTYALPTLTTNCTNNYGPYQFPEKLIPLTVLNALAENPICIYGDGQQVRDWLHVRDHCDAIARVLDAGRPGETYNIGAQCERTNLDVVDALCRCLDKAVPRRDGSPYFNLRTFGPDRPGHDRRYALNTEKLRNELGWQPSIAFDEGIEETVAWYRTNDRWVASTRAAQKAWLAEHYGQDPA
ncbi:MAG: dTDP-glucose 4,6-dehydratase [Pseudomonadota bacterium]